MRVLIVAIVVAIFAAVALADGPGCCSPNQWEGEVWGFSERQNASFFEYLSYDYQNRRLRADVYVDELGRHQQIKVSIYELYVNNVYKRFIVDAQGKCTAQNPRVPYPIQACVPQGYEHDAVWSIGAILKVHSYFYNFGRAQEFADVIVAEGSCVPIRGIAFGHQADYHGVDFAVNYFNVNLGIVNPNIFSLPGNCQALIASM